MKTWTGRATAQSEEERVEVKKTMIGRGQGKEGGKEMLRGSEKGVKSISPAMIAKRRGYLDLCNHPMPLYASNRGHISPQSPCTIRSHRFSCQSPQHNNSMNPEGDNMLLRFNSKILQGSISTSTRDSLRRVRDSSSLKDSRSMSGKDKSIKVSSKSPRENNSSPNSMKSFRFRSSSSLNLGIRGLTQPSTSRRSPLCLRPNTEAWR